MLQGHYEIQYFPIVCTITRTFGKSLKYLNNFSCVQNCRKLPFHNWHTDSNTTAFCTVRLTKTGPFLIYAIIHNLHTGKPQQICFGAQCSIFKDWKFLLSVCDNARAGQCRLDLSKCGALDFHRFSAKGLNFAPKLMSVLFRAPRKCQK